MPISKVNVKISERCFSQKKLIEISWIKGLKSFNCAHMSMTLWQVTGAIWRIYLSWKNVQSNASYLPNIN
jgi:hypothetical protein